MDIKAIFDGCSKIDSIDSELKAYLDKLMNLSSPVEFNDELANEEKLEELIKELDNRNKISIYNSLLRQAVERLESKQYNKFIFI